MTPQTTPPTHFIASHLAALCVAGGLVVAPSAATASGPVQLVFTAGSDGTKTLQRLVDAFNAEHKDKIQVTLRAMPDSNDEHRRELFKSLASEGNEPHVFASDVVWTAELAQKRLVNDATRSFYDTYKRQDFLLAALDSATYRLRIWGVPWYSDVSLLFYRKDLLQKSGFDTPPATWEDLKKMAKKVMADAGVKYGFVFQGADYEGGAVNALEFIWGAGARPITSRLAADVLGRSVAEVPTVQLNTPDVARGLDMARQLITDGVTPAAVAEFREQESLQAFSSGQAVFMRNWPYAYTAAGSSLGAQQIGIAPLPGVAKEVSRSCLGGWNLMTNRRNSEAEQKAAWVFIRYLTSPEAQKRQALEAGLLPVRVSLYEDSQVAQAVPVLSLGKNLIARQTRTRPASPVYGQLSAQISAAFGRVLKGEMSGAEAAKQLDSEVRKFATANR